MRVVHQRSTPHHGRIRLQDFDYSTSGSYYFTIVTAQREPLLGSISDGTMVRSVAGEAVLRVWNELPARFDALELDSFVVMPDHVHGIVWLTTTLADDAAGATSLIRVMRAFKSLSAREVNSQLNRSGAVWQRSYYERIVRNELELRRFREYITPIRSAGESMTIEGAHRFDVRVGPCCPPLRSKQRRYRDSRLCGEPGRLRRQRLIDGDECHPQ